MGYSKLSNPLVSFCQKISSTVCVLLFPLVHIFDLKPMSGHRWTPFGPQQEQPQRRNDRNT